MIKRILTLAGILVVSVSVNSSPISFHGYTLDEGSNIVTGGGLEWLQWDETDDSSIIQALATYGGAGWRLASNPEMAALFNTFDLGLMFDGDEETSQKIYTGVSAVPSPLTESDVQFVTLFGNTFTEHESWVNGSDDPLLYAGVRFGEDANGNGLYNFASVYDDFRQSPAFSITEGRVNISEDFFPPNQSGYHFGVALVREVPLPAAAWLFLSALGGLGIIKRRTL